MKRRLLSIALVFIVLFTFLDVHSFADESISDESAGVIENEKIEEVLGAEDESDADTINSEFSKEDDGLIREEWLKYLKDNGIEPNTEEAEDEYMSKEDETHIINLGSNENALPFKGIEDSALVGSESSPAVSKRYTVLVLDVSGSMLGLPMSKMKEACKKFFEDVFKDEAENYVAIVSYGFNAIVENEFTKDKVLLNKSIDALTAYGSTNTNAGMEVAEFLLSKIPNEDGLVKNIILLSDGLPYGGKEKETGLYKYKDYYYYAYANACYDTAKSIHSKKIRLYTLGFFHSLENAELAFGRRFMNDLQNAGYYDIDDPNDLEFVFGDVVNDEGVIIGKFRYPGAAEPKDYEGDFVYKNSYFYNSSYFYNNELATMSMCLSMSCFGSLDESSYRNKSKNVRDLLLNLGFTGFSENEYYGKKPEVDSIGVIAAHKKLKIKKNDYTLIALVVRGGGYEREWASNFKLGVEGDHEGLDDAATKTSEFLRGYIKKHGIRGNIKLWITGYSRGGGTANLISGRLNNKDFSLSPCILEPSNMYTYTFEAPQGTIDSSANNSLHNNIYNIINYNDPVPYLAPSKWDYRHYGVKKYVPKRIDTASTVYVVALRKMKSFLSGYDSFSGIEYIVDDFKVKKIEKDILNKGKFNVVENDNIKVEQGEFLFNYILNISKKLIGNRKNYVSFYQESIRNILSIIYGGTQKQVTDFGKNLGKNFKKANKLSLYLQTQKEVFRLLDDSLHEAGINDYDSKVLMESIDFPILLFKTMYLFDYLQTVTFMENSGGIVQAHLPEICLAWLQSMDKNYNDEDLVEFSKGKTRIIKINCPVDVDIYEEGELIARIINDEAVTVGEYVPCFGINEDGEKFAYLSAEGDYRVIIRAGDKGLVNYSVIEKSLENGIMRITNFFDVPIEQGTELVAELPQFSAEELDDYEGSASSQEYTLYNSTEGVEVAKSNDLVDDEARASYCEIDVETEDMNKGLAWGTGTRIKGGYAVITAFAGDGYTFDAWYEGGQRVSSEEQYRLRADRDRKFVAKFIESAPTQNGNDNSSNSNDYSEYDAYDTIDNDINPKGDVYIDNTKVHAPFIDVQHHWARERIDELWAKNMVKGYTDNTFRPDNNVSRAEIVELVLNYKGLAKTPYKDIFTDVKRGYWFAEGIQTAYDNGFIKGYPSNEFKPNQSMTRAEFGMVIYDLLGRPEVSEDKITEVTSSFKDGNAIPVWAGKALAACVDGGIFEGYMNLIKPNDFVKRAEVVVILQRLMNKKK